MTVEKLSVARAIFDSREYIAVKVAEGLEVSCVTLYRHLAAECPAC